VDANQSLLDLFGTLNNSDTPLSTLQRVLLMTDGTVTDVLEAYANEHIHVTKVSQSFAMVNSERPELDLGETDRVMRRKVLLQGSATGINYLYADSVITPDHLDSGVVEGLLTSDTPLGRLLARHRVETFREIVAVGFEPAGTCAGYFEVDPTTKLVFRTYRIIVGQRPVVRITEKFPVTHFALVS
jgi:chorismate-pyruvate lyase